MLDVPGVAQWDSIFGLQADCAGPGDSYYPIRAFPLQRQLVGMLGQLNTHEPCGYGSGTRLAGSMLHSQPLEDGLSRGAFRHLAAIALAQAHHKRALDVTRV